MSTVYYHAGTIAAAFTAQSNHVWNRGMSLPVLCKQCNHSRAHPAGDAIQERKPMRRYSLALAAVCLLLPITAAAGPEGSTTVIAAQAPQGAQAQPPPKRTEIKVPEKVLKTYVGEYAFSPERILTITLENGSLWGQPSGQEKRQLFAESQTKFFLNDIDAQVTFQKDAKGKASGLRWNRPAGRSGS